jgi:hypothetical protein
MVVMMVCVSPYLFSSYESCFISIFSLKSRVVFVHNVLALKHKKSVQQLFGKNE